MTRSAARLVRRYPGLALVALPCMVLALILTVVWSPGGATGDGATATVGAATVPQDRAAPQFDLPRLSGSGRLSSASLRGDVVVVNFWASWCRACREDAAAFRQLSRRYSASDVDFVGVDHGDVAAAARAFARRNGLRYPSVVDSGDLLGRFGGVGLPMTYVLDRSGWIRYQLIGTVDAGTLRQAIDRVRARRSQEPS